uniref:Uncharacterized protein n=1 Tax=Bubo bubo TaxID=30461 RepID=A0A8C0FP77_BUBBB
GRPGGTRGSGVSPSPDGNRLLPSGDWIWWHWATSCGFTSVSEQLSEGSMFGHGLKHLFHSRRRSREREHQNSQDSLPPHYGMSDHDSPDEKERSPEMHRVSYAMSLHDLPARPTAFNRVLQQIRSRPSINLHSGSRRAKSSSLEPQKGSPHLVRKAPQDSSLTAILHQHQGRPRSSSTTDTAILLLAAGASTAPLPQPCRDRATTGTWETGPRG